MTGLRHSMATFRFIIAINFYRNRKFRPVLKIKHFDVTYHRVKETAPIVRYCFHYDATFSLYFVCCPVVKRDNSPVCQVFPKHGNAMKITVQVYRNTLKQ